MNRISVVHPHLERQQPIWLHNYTENSHQVYKIEVWLCVIFTVCLFFLQSISLHFPCFLRKRKIHRVISSECDKESTVQFKITIYWCKTQVFAGTYVYGADVERINMLTNSAIDASTANRIIVIVHWVTRNYNKQIEYRKQNLSECSRTFIGNHFIRRWTRIK